VDSCVKTVFKKNIFIWNYYCPIRERTTVNKTEKGVTDTSCGVTPKRSWLIFGETPSRSFSQINMGRETPKRENPRLLNSGSEFVDFLGPLLFGVVSGIERPWRSPK